MYGYIYKTTCLVTNKIYIGQHKAPTFEPWYLGSGMLIRQAIIKYGRDKFRVELICSCSTLNELNEKEIYYIQHYNATDHTIGYNIEPGGKGCLMTESTKEKLRLAHLGKTATIETKQKMSESRRGKNNSFYGKCHTVETKQKIGAKSIGRHTFLGKKHTSAAKEKMRLAKLGNVPTNSLKVLCLNNNTQYESINRAAEFFKIPASTIARAIRDNRALRNGLKFIKCVEEVMVNKD